MHRQLRQQFAAGARVQQYSLVQSIAHPQSCWTETSQQQQIQKRIQDVSGLRDDTSCHRRHVEGEYSHKQPPWTDTAASTTPGSTTSYLARSTSEGRHLFANSYTRDLKVYAHRSYLHNLKSMHSPTHQPFRSRRQVCQQAKGRGGQHCWQHQEENISSIQLDYPFMHDPHVPPQRPGRQQPTPSLQL